MVGRDDKAQQQIGILMSYTWTGGVRLDYFNASYPFARLNADETRLELACLKRHYTFPKDDVDGVCIYEGLVYKGIRILHRVPAYPGLVVFWPTFMPWSNAAERIANQLHPLGYS